MKLALIILVVGMICIASVSYVAINSEEEVKDDKVYQTSMPDGVPTSPQDIINWDPSKTYGGTYKE